MRHGLPRMAATAASAALLLLSAAPAALPAAHRTLGADRGLVIVSQARYVALPDEARVQVTMDARATSYTPNSGSTIYYYPAAVFDVQRVKVKSFRQDVQLRVVRVLQVMPDRRIPHD